jgi:hypothetical protein
MLKGPLPTDARPDEDAMRVYPVPAFSMDRLEKVATPSQLVVAVTVPESVPDPGLVPSASVTRRGSGGGPVADTREQEKTLVGQ